MKRMWVLLLALTALAALMVACGRNRNDADTNSTQQTEMHETDRMDENNNETSASEEGGIVDDAEDLVSDVIDGGEEIVSDVVDGGRDVVSDIAGDDRETARSTDSTANTEDTTDRITR